jgi:hypothetical protein
MKKLIGVTTSVVLLGIATSAAADSGTAPDPMARAAQSINKNMLKHPDNQGLQKAADRLEDNRRRFDAKHNTRAAQSQKRSSSRNERTGSARGVDRAARNESVQRPERVEKVERVERTERVERPEHPERVERVERPERVERVDRPDRPGRR